MTTITVELPDPLLEWVEAQARSGRFEDGEDYVRGLIRRDRERSEAVARMQTLIDEGIASGVSERSLDEVLEEARARAKAQA